MYVDSLRIKNLRCVEKASLELLHPGREDRDGLRYPNLNVLLGVNGAGKSTFLRALALGALSPVFLQGASFPRRFWIRERPRSSAEEAQVEVDLILHPSDRVTATEEEEPQRGATLRTKVQRGEPGKEELISPDESGGAIWESMARSNPAFFMVGYGATRRVGKPSAAGEKAQEAIRYARVAGLFEDSRALAHMNQWVSKLTAPRRRQVVELIDGLLPDAVNFRGELRDGELLFEHRGIQVPFEALSDGYRAYLTWVGDLLFHLQETCPPNVRLDEFPGVALVDEIDLHLHPTWQLEALPRISRCLPRIQFICTTHSPMVVGAVESCNVRVLVEGRGRGTEVRSLDFELNGLNVDQIVTAEPFGLASSRADDFADELRRVGEQAAEDPAAALLFARLAAHGREGAALRAEDPPEWIARLVRRTR